MKSHVRAAFAATILTSLSLLCGACGHDETVVRRETYTYAPAPTPAPRVGVTTERTTVERSY
jgi:hypothetical protein